MKLGVNIDHVATVRQARRTIEPSPVAAALLAELGGADGITCHLREDRRHIQDEDLYLLRKALRTRLNLEMAATPEMTRIALEVRPDYVTLVPEKREELTTEGGLNLAVHGAEVQKAIRSLQEAAIPVSLFVNPEEEDIRRTKDLGALWIELHTGRYAEARGEKDQQRELERLVNATYAAKEQGLRVNAGHGLTYWNVVPVAQIAGVEELNIGHSIISKAVLVGMERAVREMKDLINGSAKR